MSDFKSMDSGHLKISIVIPTMDRCAVLAAMLESILSQTVPADEIIIIDQSSNEDTRQLADKYAQEKAARIIYIQKADITGAAQARNIGMARASGDVIFLFDDDVILEADYIAQTLKIYDKDPKIGCVGGIITNYNSNSWSYFFKRLFYVGPFTDNRLEIYCNKEMFDKKEYVETSKMGSGVMSLKKKVADTYKFDEHFVGYSFGEDFEYSYRISREYKLAIAPLARLDHKSLGPKFDIKKHAERNICSLSYFYIKNCRGNFIHALCYLWLCFGLWLIATMVVIKKGDLRHVQGFFSGLRIVLKNFKGCDFISGGV